MRRFLQAWGRQEPSLLCPAEAASPPPLSAFYSSPCATILPEPPNLFTNIERQLSAKLTAETLFGQPSPPEVSPQNQLSGSNSQQQSPCQQQKELVVVPTIATTPAQQQLSPPSAAITTATAAAANGDDPLLVVADQQPVQQNSGAPIQQPAPAQKGLDAFFAALANANTNIAKGTNGTLSQQQITATAERNANTHQNRLTAAFGGFGSGQQSTPATTFQSSNPLADLIAATTDSTNGNGQPKMVDATLQQVATNNAIANAVNAVNFMNAAIAVQQQQQAQAVQQVQQQIQQSQTANSLLDTPTLLASLKPSLLQRPIPIQNNDNNNSLNALQLAQSAEIQPKQPVRGPLSSEGIVQAGLPALLNRLGGAPNILRPGPSQSKPIPLLEEKVDLLRFKKKEPREWSSDDVVAWVLDVARRHQIPCENINLAKFASCTGPLLMLMNEQSFKENDMTYGSLLFGEFCKLVTDENFIDEWMRTANVAGPSHQQSAAAVAAAVNNHHQQQHQQPLPTSAANPVGSLIAANLAFHNFVSSEPGPSSSSAIVVGQQQQPNNLLLAAAAGIAAVQQQQQKAISGLGQLLPSNVPPPSGVTHLSHPNPIHPMALHSRHALAGTSQQMARASTSGAGQMVAGGMRPMRSSKAAEPKIRRNKDGRPRKRSQHTKGNKLWEFIRDALKDPRTCPSIVRWEDPSEGVFRIVESERLAYLWGQKKNNQKMTYEKLSRAMRTYYEKEILVPVPKSGLYPKKLVYKFGPSALGWKMAASLAVQSQLAIAGPPSSQYHHHHHHHQHNHHI